MKQSLMAGASSIAHFMGRPAKAKRAEEEREEKPDEEEEDKKEAKGATAADESEREEDEERKEDEEEESDDDKAKKGKKAKKAKVDAEDEDEHEDEDGDDDSDQGDMRKRGVAAARRRERARIAAIFADKAAVKNPEFAKALAFHTDVPRAQAIAALRGSEPAAEPRRQTFDERLASVKVPSVGAGDPPPRTAGSPAVMTAAAIIEAGKKRRGEI